jgi:Domain of unknown function (DUF4157)
MSDRLNTTAKTTQNSDSPFKVSPFQSHGFGVQAKSGESVPATKAQLWNTYQQAKQLNQNSAKLLPIQAKLSVGQPGDKYEQEADSVADRVMAMSEPAQVQQEELPEAEELQMKPLAETISPLVQREELPEEEELQMKPEDNVVQREALPEEEELQMKSLDNSIQREELPEEEEELQMKQSDPSTQTATPDLESQLSSSKGGGNPLSDDVRSFMEPRFGEDFSGVRVHTGNDAVQMNQGVNAQAFAHGSDIYFGAGKAPGKDALTAHELTHVMQQTTTQGVQRVPESKPKFSQISNSNTIQRFESNEHKAMGDNATKEMVELAPDFKVTFGDLTAIADFFGSVAQIKEFAKSDFGLQQIKFVIYVEIRGQKNRKSEFSKEVENAVKKRYYTLAGGNYVHFTNPKEGDSQRDFKDKVNDRADEKDDRGNPVIGSDGLPKKVPVNNAGSYRLNHESALREAYEAGKKGTSKNEAMLYEGFASHFLTDAYAAGHMRPERISIKEYWDPKVPMFWTNLKWWMAECIANHLNNQSIALSGFTEQFLWEQSLETLENKIKGKGIPDLTFGDAIAGSVHDNDNEKGVNAQVGNEVVKLVGDGAVLDKNNHALATGADTMAKVTAGVKASLQEVEMAYKGKEPSSISIDGLYRAEQLWPKPIADSDPQQDNKTLNWKVESVVELLNDPRMKEAVAKFANEKAELLSAEIIPMDWPYAKEKELAVTEGALAKLKGSPDSVCNTFLTILNYTPGTVASLGGVGGHDEDDNAVDYYQTVLKTKGGIESLTTQQREKLIQDVLSGVTVRDEQAMVVKLLQTATVEQSTKLVDKIGWHRLWKKINGKTCRQLVQTVGPSYWPKQSYETKRSEVKFLADGLTNDLAQETIITILRTCTAEEVKLMDKEIGGRLGLNFDLDGRWNKEFKQMKNPVGDYPEPNKEVVAV